MAPLPDGVYDVIVVDLDEAADGTTRLDLTIVSGERRGDVVGIRTSIDQPPLELLGMPGRLLVTDGSPRFVPDV